MATAREKPSCLIRTLPPELLGESARVASDIFPANRPAVAHFASLVPGDESDVMVPQFIAALTTRYWGPQPRVIPVSFLDDPDAATTRLILEHMNAWDCGVTFARSVTDGKVRIARSRGGYWSYLGTDILLVPAGQPTMNLEGFTARTAASEYLRVVRHETGHTLGFPHEHMRRDLVARIDPARAIAYFGQTQGWSQRDVYAQVLTPLDESSVMATPADQDSVMCYQLPASITVDGQPIRGGADINASDRGFARAIYPKAEPTPPVTPPPPPVEPPPVKPPEPTVVGPLQLAVGRASPYFDLRPGQSFLFRFTAKGRRLFVARTDDDGKGAWKMELLGPGDPATSIRSDDQTSGPAGNAAIHATLRPGVYFLRVEGMVPELSGRFRVKVVGL